MTPHPPCEALKTVPVTIACRTIHTPVQLTTSTSFEMLASSRDDRRIPFFPCSRIVHDQRFATTRRHHVKAATPQPSLHSTQQACLYKAPNQSCSRPRDSPRRLR
jgi:hypothetical protein